MNERKGSFDREPTSFLGGNNLILTLGAFDGFHRGHQKLLDRARLLAQGVGEKWAVVTFSPHPQAVLSGAPHFFLFTEDERDLIARFLGVPNLVKIDFSRWLAELAPEDFMNYLAQKLDVSGIVVGDDFRYGQARSGDVEQLVDSCRRRHWRVAVLPQLYHGDQIVSSTLVRQKVSGGDVAGASELLGYPFFVSGVVIPGDRRGRSLGFPTANLSVPQGKILPDRGVYVSGVLVDGIWWPGALNVGYNPTFEGRRSIRFEVHLPGFEGDLYGRNLFVFILARIREEMRFERAEDLIAQMTQDVSTASSTWRRNGKEMEGAFNRWHQILMKHT